LKTLGVDIIAFLSQLMEKLLFPKAGIMLYDVYHLFKEMYPNKIQLAD
jgi:hypothetical protein